MFKKVINILVIEDNPADRRFIELSLTKGVQASTFAIKTADRLADGLESLSKGNFDLLLLDLGLPDSQGLETIDKVREANANIPIVVLTGLDKEDAGIDAIKRGAMDYVIKPFSPSGLRTRIGIVLQIIELQNKLRDFAHVDQLTGLSNRHYFFSVLERELMNVRLKNTTLSLMMMDVDHFKSINDTYGHVIGDTILKQVGQILRENLYPMDIAARYGGEEFIIALPGTTAKQAYKAGERLRKIIDRWHWKVRDQEVSITVSTGITVVNSANLISIQNAIEKADNALYAAKCRGRNCVICWSDTNDGIYKQQSESREYREIQHKVISLSRQLRAFTFGTINTLTKAMNEVIKDPYMMKHGENVKEYAIAIAEEMGVSDELKERIGTAALLADLGKIGIPLYILKKTTALIEEERRIIEQHPIITEKILEPTGSFDLELKIIRHHHENFDGTGYPDRLKGKEIPIGARIILAAEAFDSMTSEHAHKSAKSGEDAIEEIRLNAGTQFDPDVAEAIEKAYEKNASIWPLAKNQNLQQSFHALVM